MTPNIVEDFLGIPFAFGGRDKKGTDCLGLVWMYLSAKGYFLPDRDDLPMQRDRQPDYMERAKAGLGKHCQQVEDVSVDDIILMRLPGGYTHMGVMVDGEHMLHVLKDRPSAIEPVLKYGPRVVGVFRPQRSRPKLKWPSPIPPGDSRRDPRRRADPGTT